jgi:hypothetical protein
MLNAVKDQLYFATHVFVKEWFEKAKMYISWDKQNGISYHG